MWNNYNTLFRVDRYFDFIIVSVENDSFYAHVVQNKKRLSLISEMVRNSSQLLSKNLFKDCQNESQEGNLNKNLKPNILKQ